MHSGWNGLGMVFVVALAAGVGAVVLFTLGVVALGRRSVAIQRRRPTLAATAAAGLCFLACAALVLYGLEVIVSG